MNHASRRRQGEVTRDESHLGFIPVQPLTPMHVLRGVGEVPEGLALKVLEAGGGGGSLLEFLFCCFFVLDVGEKKNQMIMVSIQRHESVATGRLVGNVFKILQAHSPL